MIVGKRALPAIAICAEGGPIATQVDGLATEGHVIALRGGEPGAATARRGGLGAGARVQTIAFAPPARAAWEFVPDVDDAFVRQELIETLYHVLWELVHVFFDHRGLLEGRSSGPPTTPGRRASSIRSSPRRRAISTPSSTTCAARSRRRRRRSASCGNRRCTSNSTSSRAAAAALRRRFDAGGKLLALGNGGSATDAMDVVADFRDDGRGPMDGPVRAST